MEFFLPFDLSSSNQFLPFHCCLLNLRIQSEKEEKNNAVNKYYISFWETKTPRIDHNWPSKERWLLIQFQIRSGWISLIRALSLKWLTLLMIKDWNLKLAGKQVIILGFLRRTAYQFRLLLNPLTFSMAKCLPECHSYNLPASWKYGYSHCT